MPMWKIINSATIFQITQAWNNGIYLDYIFFFVSFKTYIQ